jgi:hypothetical protein
MKIWEFLKKIFRPFFVTKDNTREEHGTAAALPPEDEKQILSSLKSKNMAMFNYEVGGNEVKVDANEAINEIQANKTLLVSQLTSEEPIQPEIIPGLKTVEDVFRHFKPSIEIEMTTAQGESVRENMRFGKLDDFSPKGITRQSAFLNTLRIQQEQYTKIMKQLKSNKVLQTMLANPETKDAIINALKQVTSELEANESK